MKRRISITLTILSLPLGLGLLTLWLAAPTSSGPFPALQGVAALNHLKEQGLFGSLQEAVTTARYNLYQESKQSGAWVANNPAQGLRARFTPDGLQVEIQGDGGRSHRLGIKLRSAGYGKRQMAVSAGRLSTRGDFIEYERTVGSGEWGAGFAQRSSDQSAFSNPQSAIVEWYHNTAAGLEQGFTIESAPGERRDGEWLRVALALDGGLRAEVVEGGQALEFTDDGGQRALRYDHLMVRDGSGRELKARMAVSMDGDEVWLEVDDRDAVWPVTIDPTFTQQQKLVASDSEPYDTFGGAVAISGETAVVGAALDDGAAGSNQGSAYIFVRSGGVWSQQQKVEASDGANGAEFGTSVAISGETIVVGAPIDDVIRGSAYIFSRSGGVWSEQQKLEASARAVFDLFGRSVAISGETVLVGAPGHDSPHHIDQGATYVFVHNGGVWSQQQMLEDSRGDEGDQFGAAVAIDGETIVVCAPFNDSSGVIDNGSAHIFARNGEIWSEQTLLLAPGGGRDSQFGTSVAISGETLVIGAPFNFTSLETAFGAAHIFVRSDGVWRHQQRLRAPDAIFGNLFGFSVAISGDTIVVGAPLDDGPAGTALGSASVFIRSGEVWSEQQKLRVSDGEAILRFGSPVAMSGETIVVGAYIFAVTPNTPPAITAASMSRIQGLAASTSTIAQLNDAEDTPSALTVTVNGAASATAGGVTVSSISVDASGQVTASVGADCNASNASFTLRVTDSGGLFAEATLNVTVNPETTPPVLACPSNVVVTLPPNSLDTGIVVNYPAPTAIDNCTPMPAITTSQASGTVFPLGLTTVNVTATDAAGNQASCSFTVTVGYNFSGFFAPVDNPPTVNVVNAGRAIPVRFSLSGDKGLNIFAASYPVSQQIACSDGAPSSDIEQTVTAGGSSLSYDATSDQYTYVWKTENSWAGTCRQLIVRLNDGSERVAFFKFR